MQLFIKSVKMILLVSVMAGIMNLVRFFVTGYDSYLWLNWNLFLALVPLLPAWLLVYSKKYWVSILLLVVWVGFLPNAPYLLTDFIHMADVGPRSFLWFDAAMIFTYTIAGMSSWVVSLHMIRSQLSWPVWSVWFIAILTSFGVYLGRYIRFNTWDIIANPGHLFETIGGIIISPGTHTPVVMMVVVFTLILGTMYFGWTSLAHYEKTTN